MPASCWSEAAICCAIPPTITASVFDPKIAGKTDRFVFKFKKPR